MIRLLPLILLTVVLSIYWGRVLQMANKSRRKTGRAANILPAEPVGRIIRALWLPVVTLWVAGPLVTAIVKPTPALMTPLFYSPWIAWPALIVAGVCLRLSWRCWKAMGKHWRMGIDPAEQNPLIAAGPFARVRHPIYTLSALMMLATMTMLPSPLMLAAGCIHIAFLVWESRREELHLIRLHGQTYLDYQRRVGGFIPRLTKSTA